MVTVSMVDWVALAQPPRHIVSGVTATAAASADMALVTIHDRASMAIIGAAHSGPAGAYQFNVPAEYAGLRELLIIANYPTDQYNAVVADRVMPETVIE